MRRYARTIGIFWSAALSADLEYRANFLVALLTSAGTLLGVVFTLSLLYQNQYEMGNWPWAHALMVLALYTILDGIQASFLAPNRTRITEYIREGTLDFVLLKPFDTQIWLSMRHVSIWGMPNIVLGLVLLVVAGTLADPPVAWWQYLLGLIPIALGVTILYSIGFLLSTLTIWFVKMYNITIAMESLLEAGRYPVAAYPELYRIFFTFVLPVAFMTTVPAELVLGRTSWWWLALAGVIAVALLLLSRAFWSFAMRYYTSASS